MIAQFLFFFQLLTLEVATVDFLIHMFDFSLV